MNVSGSLDCCFLPRFLHANLDDCFHFVSVVATRGEAALNCVVRVRRRVTLSDSRSPCRPPSLRWERTNACCQATGEEIKQYNESLRYVAAMQRFFFFYSSHQVAASAAAAAAANEGRRGRRRRASVFFSEEQIQLESETRQNHHNAGLPGRRSPPALSPESSAASGFSLCEGQPGAAPRPGAGGDGGRRIEVQIRSGRGEQEEAET